MIWDVGYDLPSYLSIENSILTVSSVTAETAVELRLKAVNIVGATAN